MSSDFAFAKKGAAQVLFLRLVGVVALGDPAKRIAPGALIVPGVFRGSAACIG